MNVALGSASLKYLAYPYLTLPSLSVLASNPYWLLWASSAIIITFLLSVKAGISPSSGLNFWIVVNIIPPDSLSLSKSNNPFTSFELSLALTLDCFCSSESFLTSACFGVCLKISADLAKVPNNWSSKSFLSVKTTIVGLFNCFTNCAA